MAAEQLHASFPNFFFFPGFFPNTWQLPDCLSSAPILEWLLLLLHTHTLSLSLSLLYLPRRGRGGWLVARFSVLLSLSPFWPEVLRGVLFPVQQFHCRYAEGEKTSYYHLHISFATDLFSSCHSSPSQGGLPNALLLVSPGKWWQSFAPLPWLLSLSGFHPSCPAHWGFEQARSQVAQHNLCKNVYLSTGLDRAQ